MTIKIYAGLSLPLDEARSHLPTATVVRPVRRGDVLRDIDSGVHTIGIVDGFFHQSLAVSVSEIMDALRCGVVVYGAASMGALRAAELVDFGMRGCGRIFETIRSLGLFRDDLVAQSVIDDGTAIRPASVAWVDVAAALETAVREKQATPRQQARILEALAHLEYSRRTLSEVTAALEQQWAGDSELIEVASAALLARPTQKQLDAVAMLDTIRSDLERTREINLRIDSAMRSRDQPDTIESGSAQ